jgi:tRNA(Ile)-lysidine synthase
MRGLRDSESHPRFLANGDAPQPLMLDPVAKLLELAGPKPQVVVAFSGGVDSTVLAHLLVKQRRKLGGLRLIHVDHGLQAASAEWSRHCARLARAWRVPFASLRAKIDRQPGESLEAAARDARYALIGGTLEPGEVLVTAQHRDDQVETLLLQLFRGAGVAGLAAMPRKARLGRELLVRPMLDATRAEIEQYAKANRLAWVEDPSNATTQFGRNFLRHAVLPGLRARWLGIDEAIARSARHVAEAAELVDAVALRDLATAVDGDGLSAAALRALPVVRRRNALRVFIARAGFQLPSTAKMTEIAVSLLQARADAQPEVNWNRCVMRRRAGRLELEVTSEDGQETQLETLLKSWHWSVEREFVVNGLGDTIELIDDAEGPIDLDKFPEEIEVRQRQGGEKLRPGARARTQALKKLLQSARTSVEVRTRLPLLFTGVGPKASLIAAGDRWIDASIAATVKSRRRARLKWTMVR